MLRKKTICFLGLCAAFLVAAASLRGEMKFPSDASRADGAAADELAPSRVEFSTNYEEAVARAKREGKPAMIFFMAENCPFSRAMLEGAFADPEIAQLSNKFVCVAVDVNDADADDICADFDVAATPTVQFTTAGGVRLSRLARTQTVEDLAGEMRDVLDKIAWRAPREISATFLR